MSTSTAKTVNRLLWSAQTIAALVFLFAGSVKFIMPADKMQQGPIQLPLAFMYFIGLCEVLGAFGLLLPGIFRIRTALTPLAAAGLTIIMIGATVLSVEAMGISAAPVPAILGAITAWIAYARARVVPLAVVRGAFRIA